MQLESQSRLDNFLKIDEQWKMAESHWVVEKDKYQADLSALTQEVSKIKEEKQTLYKVAQLSKDELLQVRTQYEQLVQELFYKKQQMVQLKERLGEAEMALQELVNTDSEKQINRLKAEAAALEREKRRWQTNWFCYNRIKSNGKSDSFSRRTSSKLCKKKKWPSSKFILKNCKFILKD